MDVQQGFEEKENQDVNLQQEQQEQQANDQFTPDEDFKELKHKDETTELIGFINEVHAPTVVGSKAKYDLFKFVLNNGGSKRIYRLVWGMPTITKVVGQIQVGDIIHIEGGEAKAVALNFYKEANNFVPFELLIKESTTITNLGRHVMPGDRPVNVNQVQMVEFSEVGKARGMICIEGYLKMKFVRVLQKYKQQYYGCGSITDGDVKVIVHIMNYTDINIEKGTLIKIMGEIQEGDGPTTIVCRDDSAISPVAGANRMGAAALARGVKSPKRGLQ